LTGQKPGRKATGPKRDIATIARLLSMNMTGKPFYKLASVFAMFILMAVNDSSTEALAALASNIGTDSQVLSTPAAGPAPVRPALFHRLAP